MAKTKRIATEDEISFGQRELPGFLHSIKLFKPREGSIPKIKGFDIAHVSMPLYNVGGDHITFMNFQKRYVLQAHIKSAEGQGRQEVVENLRKNYHRGGFYLIDVAGHNEYRCNYSIHLAHIFSCMLSL